MKKYITLFLFISLRLLFCSCEHEEWKRVSIDNVKNEENVVLFQKHTQGKGIMIVLLANGYADEVGTLYDMYNHLFREPPYPSLKQFFDVVGIVGADSLHLGISVQGDSYAADIFSIKDLVKNTFDSFSLNYTCVVIAVSPDLGNKRSVAYLYSRPQSPTVALCRWADCTDKYKTYVLAHEVGGHCLAGLEDEYVEFDNEITAEEKFNIESFQANGLLENVSLSAESVPWKDLLAYTQCYDDISIVEGAASYRKGVFRSSQRSIMSTSLAGFNTVSRYLIWKNVHERAGCPSSLSQFLDYDKINLDSPISRSFSTIEQIPESMRGIIRKNVFE